jgi:hypothetical protein
MKTLATTLVGLVLALSLKPASAQLPGAINQVDSAQQRRQMEESMKTLTDGDNAPEFYAGESSDVGPQSVLSIKPRRTHFEAQADVQYFYTDNMFLLENPRQSAGVLLSTVQFALAPTAYEMGGGQFSPRLGYRHQWFDYGLGNATLDNTPSFELSEFNFNAQTAFIDGRWSRDNWIVQAGFDYTRLMDSSDYDDFYQEYVPRWGVQRLLPLSESSTLAVGYEGDYRFTDSTSLPPFLPSDMMDRMDHALFAACTVVLCEHAVVQPYYRFKYTHFTEGGDRDDYLHSVGLGVYGFITRNITVRAYVNYDARNSSEDLVPEYRQFNAGGGVNVTVRF